MSHKLVSLYIGEGEYYTRTDADNVIAEKDAEIAQLQAMLEERNKQIGELKEERRWRKFSEEKPEHHQDILCYCPRAKFCKVALRRWDEGMKFDVFEQYLYTHWMPLPKAPEADK